MSIPELTSDKDLGWSPYVDWKKRDKYILIYLQQAEHIKVIEEIVWELELIKAIVNFLVFL